MRSYGFAAVPELSTTSSAPCVKVCRLKPLLKIAFQEHHEDALGVKVKAHLGACSSDYLTSCHENKANC